ncbi:MAG: hypothetical protein RL208_773, partial [Pseudomonadota bacterium]
MKYKVIKRIFIGFVEFTLIPNIAVYFFTVFLEKNQYLKLKIPSQFRKIQDLTPEERVRFAINDNKFSIEECENCIKRIYSKKYNVAIVIEHEVEIVFPCAKNKTKCNISKSNILKYTRKFQNYNEFILDRINEDYFFHHIPSVPQNATICKIYDGDKSVSTKAERGYLFVKVYVDGVEEFKLIYFFARYGDVILPKTKGNIEFTLEKLILNNKPYQIKLNTISY